MRPSFRPALALLAVAGLALVAGMNVRLRELDFRGGGGGVAVPLLGVIPEDGGVAWKADEFGDFVGFGALESNGNGQAGTLTAYDSVQLIGSQDRRTPNPQAANFIRNVFIAPDGGLFEGMPVLADGGVYPIVTVFDSYNGLDALDSWTIGEQGTTRQTGNVIADGGVYARAGNFGVVTGTLPDGGPLGGGGGGTSVYATVLTTDVSNPGDTVTTNLISESATGTNFVVNFGVVYVVSNCCQTQFQLKVDGNTVSRAFTLSSNLNHCATDALPAGGSWTVTGLGVGAHTVLVTIHTDYPCSSHVNAASSPNGENAWLTATAF